MANRVGNDQLRAILDIKDQLARQIAAWERDIAPSAGLRKWYNHERARWPEFRTRYLLELDAHGPALDRLGTLARSGPLTLVFAARDSEHSSAAVLRERLLGAG